MLRKVLLLTCVALLAFGSLFAQGAAEEGSKELVVAMHSARTDEVVWGIAEKIKEGIEEKTDGALMVRLVGPEVGSERDLLEGASRGEYQIMQSGDMVIAQYAPKYGVTSVPFVFPDYESVAMAYDGKLGEKMNESLKENGNLRLIGRSLRGARLLTATKPIRTPADLNGVKIRVPEIATWLTAWQAVGAQPTPVAWSEVFTALQTGVVDAQENPIAQIYEAKLYEVQDYIMMTEHLLAYFHWVINDDFLNSLSSEQQQIVLDVVKEATDWGTSQQDAASQAKLEEMIDEYGVEVIQPDKKAFFDAAKPAIEKISNEEWAPEVAGYLNEILNR
jgi:tripartite ATP-independent transporter DctP family solute receptor